MSDKSQRTPNSFKVIPLGGVEEIGINCTAIEYNDHILVIDAGLGFSDVDHLGVDYLIPNFDYLKENKSKLEGFFITHGHLDHIGAIAHFAEELGQIDIFAPEFAAELIKLRAKEAKIENKINLRLVGDKSVLHNGKVTVEYFRVNHSIPDSFGIIIKTPAGTIVHSGDFKFDNSPLNEPTADYLKMARTGEEGVKVLLSDSTNSTRKGHSISEYEIMGRLSDVISSAKGRVIVATFSSLVTRLYALVEIAKQEERKVFISGRSMANSIDISKKLGYIRAKNDLFVKDNQINRYSDENVLILATGSQGENMSALARMARGEHRQVKLKRGDTVILSSSVIPGNDLLVQNLIDDLSRLGAKIYHQDIMNLHTSGHGFQEDQKLMINLFKPEYFMPVHGTQYFLAKHGETAVNLGVDEKKVILSKRGDIVEIGERSWKKVGRVKHNPLLVSGSGVGDVGPLVLQDREQLAANGVVVINIVLKVEDSRYRLAVKPNVFSRGFIYVKENRDMIDKIVSKVEFVLSRNDKQQDNAGDFKAKLRTELEKHVGGMLYSLTERDPLLITNIEIVKF